jgi:hypothetical protein
MVALLEKTDYTVKTAHRARGATSPYSAPVQLRSNSANRIEFRRFTYDNRRRLESCSRDPIGFEGSRFNLTTYVRGRPTKLVDPFGLLDSTIDPKTPVDSDCGKLSLAWEVSSNNEVDESLVVQKICFEIMVIECLRTNGCCKGFRRSSCNICYYEVLIDRLKENAVGVRGKTIDDWQISMPIYSQGCGTKGSILITSEIRSYSLTARKDFPYPLIGQPGGPKVFYDCELGLKHLRIQGNEESSSAEPSWWSLSGSSIFRFARLNWNCCTDPNKVGPPYYTGNSH